MSIAIVEVQSSSGAVSTVEVESNGQAVTTVEVGSTGQGIAIIELNQGPAGASATVDQTIIDGSVNAVAGNAVFDALALKAPLASPTFTGIVTAPRITGRCDGLEVFCKAGLAINAGQVVYVTGASGNNIVIGLARANAEATSSKTIGISQSTLANNATGYVITEGLLTVSISAPTANEGDPIWLSPATAGGMVFGAANKPSAPNHIVYLGVVTRKTGNTVVEIYVKIQNGAELDELSDVAITSAVAGQALMRGTTLWENRSLVSADISDATSAATANTIALRDETGGANFGDVGAASISADNQIKTSGETATIWTEGSGGHIYTAGSDATIFTQGANANIGTTGANAYIQSRSTFKLFNGTYITTLSHSPTADRAIAFPNKAGTVAMTSDITGTNSGTNTGDETGARIASLITAATSKTTPVDADEISITDSAASFGLKKLTFANLKTALNTLYVSLTGNQTIAGNKTFSGQTELTGQAATNDTSAMTRSLADTRYGGQLYYRILSSSVSYTNDATGTVILSVALPIGTYSIDAFIRFTANSANSKVTPSILEGALPAFSGYRGSYGNGSSPSRIAGVNTGPSGGGPWGATSNADNHERGGILVVTSGTNTYQLTTAQNTSSATTTTVGQGSYLIIRKIA